MAEYATITEVRREAGFENNTDVSDPLDVTPATNAANARVEAAVARKYILPLSDSDYYSGSSAEALLKTLASQIGASILLKSMYEGQGGELIAAQNERAKGAKEQLELIGNGTIKLIGTDGSVLTTISANLTAPSGYPKKSDLADSTDDKNLQTINVNEVF